MGEDAAVIIVVVVCVEQNDEAVGKVSKTATRGVEPLMVGNVDLVSS